MCNDSILIARIVVSFTFNGSMLKALYMKLIHVECFQASIWRELS